MFVYFDSITISKNHKLNKIISKIIIIILRIIMLNINIITLQLIEQSRNASFFIKVTVSNISQVFNIQVPNQDDEKEL